jgi:hypothetical protein
MVTYDRARWPLHHPHHQSCQKQADESKKEIQVWKLECSVEMSLSVNPSLDTTKDKPEAGHHLQNLELQSHLVNVRCFLEAWSARHLNIQLFTLRMNND